MTASFRMVWRTALVCFATGALLAQSAGSASIRGQVTDSSNAVIEAATVELLNAATGWKRTMATQHGGYYAFADVPLTGELRLQVSRPGFETTSQAGLQLRAGETAVVDVVLPASGGRSQITVLGTAEGVRSDSPQLGLVLNAAKIENTPVLGRKLPNLVLLNSAVRPARGTGDLFLNNTLFVVNGSGRRQTSYVLDGSTADDAWGRQTIFTNVPLVALQEFTLLTSAFSAEFGRTTGSVVNVNTRTGTNDWHGEFLSNVRPGGIQARSPLSDLRTVDELDQFSGMLAGPVRRDRTFILVAGEWNHQERDSIVTSLLAPQNYRGQYEQQLGLARLDHRWSRREALTARVSLDRFDDTNPADAVGGLALPPAAREFRRAAYAAQLSETSVLRARLLNDARLQFQLGSPITQFQPVTPSTQYVRPGLATEGESRYANLQSRQWQLVDALSWNRGRHNVRSGVDLMYARSGGVGQEFGGGYVLGQFTLRPGIAGPIASLTADDVQRYTQSFGNLSYTVSQWLGAGFVQDNWRLRPNLTLDAGLRYERQSFSDDTAMWSPRVGLAYHPFRDSRTVLRSGFGVYYSQLRANLAAGYQIGGPLGIFSFSVAPGQLGFPADLRPLTGFPPGAALPARDITVRAGDRTFLNQFLNIDQLRRFPEHLLNPRTLQWTAGVEREILPRWTLSADYVHQLTSRIDRPIDLNAPAPFVRTAAGQVRSAAAADATRPIVPVANGFRRVLATVNDGLARYDALQVNLNRRFSGRFSVLASYTYAHALNTVEPDVPSQDPNDANLLGRAERATSLLNQRHRAALSGWWQPGRGWSMGTSTFLASGRPYVITTGVDNNGDGSTADRPVVNGALLPRNAGRGTPFYDVQTIVEKSFSLAGERLRVSVRGEVYNLLNHANIVGRNGTWGNADTPAATLGQALGGIGNVDPGRQFQFLARLRF